MTLNNSWYGYPIPKLIQFTIKLGFLYPYQESPRHNLRKGGSRKFRKLIRKIKKIRKLKRKLKKQQQQQQGGGDDGSGTYVFKFVLVFSFYAHYWNIHVTR